MKQTTEKAFESYVEQMLLAKGWKQGNVSGWDKERALFPQAITDFIAAGVCQRSCPIFSRDFLCLGAIRGGSLCMQPRALSKSGRFQHTWGARIESATDSPAQTPWTTGRGHPGVPGRIPGRGLTSYPGIPLA
jgi:hypothetical protein